MAESKTKEGKEEKNIFKAQVQQAGIFRLFYPDGFDANKKEHKENEEILLEGYCPNILFPYAREVISGMIMKSDLPPLNLAPINFEMMHKQHREKKEVYH